MKLPTVFVLFENSIVDAGYDTYDEVQNYVGVFESEAAAKKEIQKQINIKKQKTKADKHFKSLDALEMVKILNMLDRNKYWFQAHCTQKEEARDLFTYIEAPVMP